MHELSIAASVVRTVVEALPGRVVRVVTVEVGVLSGVQPSALVFAWDLAAAGTPLVGSRLDVVEVPLRTACRDCGERAALAEPLPVRCPACGSREVEVSGGRDLQVATVEVEDEDEDEADHDAGDEDEADRGAGDRASAGVAVGR